MFRESSPFMPLGGGLSFDHGPKPRVFEVTRDFTTGRVSTQGAQNDRSVFPDDIVVSELTRPVPFEDSEDTGLTDTESEEASWSDSEESGLTDTESVLTNTDTGIYPIEVSEGVWRGSCGCKRRYVTRGSCDVAHCTIYPSTRGKKLSECLW